MFINITIDFDKSRFKLAVTTAAVFLVSHVHVIFNHLVHFHTKLLIDFSTDNASVDK